MKSNNLYLWITVLLSVFLGFTLGSNQQIVFNATNFEISSSQKLKQFIQYIETNYVDDIDTDSLVNTMISNAVEQLDPHSVYIPKEEMQQITRLKAKVQKFINPHVSNQTYVKTVIFYKFNVG